MEYGVYGEVLENTTKGHGKSWKTTGDVFMNPVY